MRPAHAKRTSQHQISVPAEIGKKLGLGPGSILEWSESEGTVTVRKAGSFSSLDVRRALFGAEGARPAQNDVKNGIRAYIRRKHARD